MTTKWEYKTRPVCHIREPEYKYPHEIMTEMGLIGWEAICIHEGYIYFKRPIVTP